MEIKVLKDILSANEQIARKNRELLEKNKVFSVNIMASPGAGKTSLVLQTIRALGKTIKVGVIEGDISSSIDAQIVGKEGVPVVQINTGGECHLDANMIQNALNNLPLK
jgi:hydrogenase nickel incorporation protein HypB